MHALVAISLSRALLCSDPTTPGRLEAQGAGGHISSRLQTSLPRLPLPHCCHFSVAALSSGPSRPSLCLVLCVEVRDGFFNKMP